MNIFKKLLFVFSVLFLSSYAVPTYAKGNLTLYCSVEIEVCELLIQGFTKETGIDVAMKEKVLERLMLKLKQKLLIQKEMFGTVEQVIHT